MPQNRISKQEAIAYLADVQRIIKESEQLPWAAQKYRLQAAGKAVGYTPAFRCLVMDLTPEESVRWEEN